MHLGLRFRLAATIVALVAFTGGVLGIGAAVAVDNALRDRLLAEAVREANFDLSVLVPQALATAPTRDGFLASDLPDALQRRGSLDTIADFGTDGTWVSSPRLTDGLASIPSATRATANAGGQLAYAWTTLAGRSSLVVGGRPASVPATFWFVRSTADVEAAVATLRAALAIGALTLVVVALVAAQRLARGILRPIGQSAAAAERIASGDLTARVSLTTRDELGALGGSLNRMAIALEDTIGRLRSAEAQNRRFVSDVAHELRTPLAALVAEASLVRDGLAGGELGPSERRAAELLVADVGRLRTLVEDLMELSRFDAAAEEPRREQVELGALVRSITAARSPEAIVHVPREPVVASTEPRRLDRILGNLLDNAREHAPGAAVEVGVARDGAGAVVTVRDHGSGVSAAALPHLFERFWKADPARTGGSSGLGLAIAREHAHVLGATLEAENAADGGLAVTLRLPLDQAVAQSLPAGDGGVTAGNEAGPSSEPASGRAVP
ncbi:MAG TPA: HAMP domain-containing sensor histidine kinase [Candidatus Limnocylindrales bacterium]|nr:HAMP domain-containing sensor histidine kinase [Candidatus Limnocylindrales bacterium]